MIPATRAARGGAPRAVPSAAPTAATTAGPTAVRGAESAQRTGPGPCAATGAHPRIPALSASVSSLAEARRLDASTAGGGTRQRVQVRGRVAELLVPAMSQAPTCEALLLVQDPEHPEALPAPLRLVWQGQRTVPGVGAGTELSCSGLLCDARDRPTIHNPRFEIVSRRGQR